MHAVILAAGSGERLKAYTGGRYPKCLLKLEQKTLLERHLHHLQHCGIRQLTIVTGFAHEQIEAELQRLAPDMQIRCRYNPAFEQGSVLSLLAAADTLRSGDPILLMDADVLYPRPLLEQLLASDHGNCFLLDRDFAAGEEPVKLCVQQGQLVEFRKRLAPDLAFDVIGESVGFFRLTPTMAHRLAERCQVYRDREHGDQPHEEALRDLLLSAPEAFGYEEITGMPWLEIDFAEDIRRAQAEILPRLKQLETD